MKKRGKNKLFIILGISMIMLLVTGVVISASNNGADTKDTAVPEEASNYVQKFIEKKGIDSDSINNITEVDFNALPKEVNIENVNDANLAIYQIDYNKTAGKQEKVFVVTYSVEKLKSQGDIILSQDKREFLNFGLNTETAESVFLKTATGVEGSSEKGYVMMRTGSITGISTSLDILSGNGQLELAVYRNGEEIQFGNSFVVNSAGTEKDYDVQSKGTITFVPGDIISVYVKASDGIAYKDVTTLLEITTN